MSTLVRFLMLNIVQSVDDLFAYTESIKNGLIKYGLITKVVFEKETLDYDTISPIVVTEDNIFVIDYIYIKGDCNTDWQLVFKFGTFNSARLLL